jgi:hypothetical protein
VPAGVRLEWPSVESLHRVRNIGSAQRPRNVDRKRPRGSGWEKNAGRCPGSPERPVARPGSPTDLPRLSTTSSRTSSASPSDSTTSRTAGSGRHSTRADQTGACWLDRRAVGAALTHQRRFRCAGCRHSARIAEQAQAVLLRNATKVPFCS